MLYPGQACVKLTLNGEQILRRKFPIIVKTAFAAVCNSRVTVGIRFVLKEMTLPKGLFFIGRCRAEALRELLGPFLNFTITNIKFAPN
jgi:hypothetical protein